MSPLTARIAGLLLTLASGAAWCAQPVRIALSFPFSGPFAIYGEVYLREYRPFADEINARGGVLGGRPLEIMPLDNKGSAQEALGNLRMVTDMQVPFLVQGAGSHIALALSDGVARHNEREPGKRLLYLNQSGDYDLANRNCCFWTFLFDAHTGMRMEALVSGLVGRPAITSVFLINQDYAHGHNVSSQARSALARLRPDIRIAGEVLHPLGKVKDFSPYAARIKASGAQVVITGNWGTDLSLLIKAAAEAGLDVEFHTFYGSDPGVPTALGAGAAGKVSSVYRWHPNVAGSPAAADDARYRERYGSDYHGLPVKNLLEMLVRAIDLAGTTEALAVARALEELRYTGATGEVWMRREDHQLAQPLYLFTLAPVDGKEVRQDLEGTGIGTRTVRRIEAADTMRPADCRMHRP